MRSYCEHIPCILIANKIDVNYDVTKRPFKFGEKHGLPLYFVSAADGTNVVKIFQDSVRNAMHYKKNPPMTFEREVMEMLDDEDFL